MAEKQEWYARQDFDLKNLQCRKGNRLPDPWQYPGTRRWLQEKYGKDCVEKRAAAPFGGERPVPEILQGPNLLTAPPGAVRERAKGSKGKAA